MKLSKDFKEIKGDASFRKFYRNKKKKSIIVFAKKEKNRNLLIYDAINKILIKNKIVAPKLIDQNYQKNYIEIKDLGNKTIYQTFINNKKNFYLIFKKIIKILNKIQLLKTKKLNIFKHKFDKEIKFLLSKINYKNDTFVHRDFHISNLIINLNNQIGLVDNQDALIGNKAYDLVSLIDDVRFKTPNYLKEKVYKYYLKTNKKIKPKKFRNDFVILSVLRNLKIIGIFMRLSERDNKKKYLKLIPYAWRMIDSRMSENDIFINLKLLLKSNFPKSFDN